MNTLIEETYIVRIYLSGPLHVIEHAEAMLEERGDYEINIDAADC